MVAELLGTCSLRTRSMNSKLKKGSRTQNAMETESPDKTDMNIGCLELTGRTILILHLLVEERIESILLLSELKMKSHCSF